MDRAKLSKVAENPAGKAAYRARQRTLSWPEKVRVVIELQRIAAPVLRARGKTVTVWPEDENPGGGAAGKI